MEALARLEALLFSVLACQGSQVRSARHPLQERVQAILVKMQELVLILTLAFNACASLNLQAGCVTFADSVPVDPV